MSHFGRAGPPDISDTYSLLVLNISFRTSADDLFPLFDKYGKVVDVFIPRDRRTGDSRGFAFVRYKYADEAQKAVDKLDGQVVDGREIMVQFAKYGPNAERIHKGRIVEPVSRSRSRSPRPSYEYFFLRGYDPDDMWGTASLNKIAWCFFLHGNNLGSRYRDEYRDRDYRRRSRSRSRGRYDRGRERDYHRRSRSHSGSPDYRKDRGRGAYDDEKCSHSLSPGCPRGSVDGRKRKERSPLPKSVSPRGRSDSRSPSPRSDADE